MAYVVDDGLFLGGSVDRYSALIAILLLLAPITTQAGVVQFSMPSNVAGTMTAPTVAGSATFASGAFSSPMTTNIGGKVIQMPTVWRTAANASQYAANAVRLNPALLVGTAVAAWLLPYGIEYLNGQFVKPPVGYAGYGPVISGGASCPVTNAEVYCACNTNSAYTISVNGYQNGLPHDGKCNSPNWGPYNGYFTWANATIPAKTPVVETDWNPVYNQPILDAAATRLSQQGVAIPLQSPEVDPAPITAPISDPYLDPVTGKTYQDAVRVTPMPTSPGSAQVDPFRQEVTPQGVPVVDPQTQTQVPPEEKPQQDMCEIFPDRPGCVAMGTPSSINPVASTHNLEFTPDTLSVPGVCPADKSFTAYGKTFSVSMAPACDAASSYVRPLILLLASVTAYFIFVGGLRS